MRLNQMNENEEILKEDFMQQMEDFETKTVKEILVMLEEKGYILPVATLGLISIVRALITNFGNKELLDEAVHYLTLDADNLEEATSDIPDAENIIKEEE